MTANRPKENQSKLIKSVFRTFKRPNRKAGLFKMKRVRARLTEKINQLKFKQKSSADEIKNFETGPFNPKYFMVRAPCSPFPVLTLCILACPALLPCILRCLLPPCTNRLLMIVAGRSVLVGMATWILLRLSGSSGATAKSQIEEWASAGVSRSPGASAVWLAVWSCVLHTAARLGA